MKTKNQINNSKCYTDPRGNKFWRDQKKRLHREDGPAVEYFNGAKEWWLYDKRHREDGPAVEYARGHKEWWVNNKSHRLDGPAIEDDNGYKEWWINDVKYPSEKEYWLKIYEMKLITKEELFLKLL